MPNRIAGLLALILAALLAGLPAQAGVIKHIVVIAMENTDASSIYGNKTEAPYINNVLNPQGARVFGLPVLSTVSAANSFRDLFIPGYFP